MVTACSQSRRCARARRAAATAAGACAAVCPRVTVIGVRFLRIGDRNTLSTAQCTGVIHHESMGWVGKCVANSGCALLPCTCESCALPSACEQIAPRSHKHSLSTSSSTTSNAVTPQQFTLPLPLDGSTGNASQPYIQTYTWTLHTQHTHTLPHAGTAHSATSASRAVARASTASHALPS